MPVTTGSGRGPTPPALAAPGNPHGTPYDTFIDITWNPVRNAHTYHYQVQHGSSNPANRFTSGTHARFTGLSAGTPYRWRVSVSNPLGHWSDWRNFRTSGHASGAPATVSGTGVGCFLRAIREQESGGNYRASNPSGASGAYQFEFGTWQYAMSLAGLGGSTYAHQRAANAPPAIQDAAAQALMLHYYNQFGHSWFNVAEAWYGGPGSVGHPGIGGGPGYPNVGQYADSVIAKYRTCGGTGGAPVVGTSAVGIGSLASGTMLQRIESASGLLEEDIPADIAHIQQQALIP